MPGPAHSCLYAHTQSIKSPSTTPDMTPSLGQPCLGTLACHLPDVASIVGRASLLVLLALFIVLSVLCVLIYLQLLFPRFPAPPALLSRLCTVGVGLKANILPRNRRMCILPPTTTKKQLNRFIFHIFIFFLFGRQGVQFPGQLHVPEASEFRTCSVFFQLNNG